MKTIIIIINANINICICTKYQIVSLFDGILFSKWSQEIICHLEGPNLSIKKIKILKKDMINKITLWKFFFIQLSSSSLIIFHFKKYIKIHTPSLFLKIYKCGELIDTHTNYFKKWSSFSATINSKLFDCFRYHLEKRTCDHFSQMHCKIFQFSIYRKEVFQIVINNAMIVA